MELQTCSESLIYIGKIKKIKFFDKRDLEKQKNILHTSHVHRDLCTIKILWDPAKKSRVDCVILVDSLLFFVKKKWRVLNTWWVEDSPRKVVSISVYMYMCDAKLIVFEIYHFICW